MQVFSDFSASGSPSTDRLAKQGAASFDEVGGRRPAHNMTLTLTVHGWIVLSVALAALELSHDPTVFRRIRAIRRSKVESPPALPAEENWKELPPASEHKS